MKYILLIIALLVAGCSEFPTKYEVIEQDKVRLLDFIYEPADAAPGDTVTLKAVFAGKRVTADMIDWSASWKVAVNVYGYDTAYDRQPLKCYPKNSYFSDQTSCIELSFVIPDSIMYISPMLKSDWTSMMPVEYRDLIPDDLRRLTKNAVLDTIAQLSAMIRDADDQQLRFIEASMDESELRDLSGLLQLFTVKLQLFADVKGSHLIQDDYTVRYNRIFNRLSPEIFRTNTNPVIDSVLIYKVNKEKLIRFKPTDPHQVYKLFAAPSDSETVIPVDKKCTYFIRSYTSNVDTSFTLQDLQSGNENGIEIHRRVFMYQHDSKEIGDISSKDFMDIQGTDSDTLSVLFPPLNPGLKKFTLWLRVYDELYNENFRNDASTLKEFRGTFAY
ncbi:MAG TPA: hypothetical protein VHO70_10465 [Chitinispirillaceae bacterium]|nr:hypothetical protein [Chitinispirillaceae bacterium]